MRHSLTLIALALLCSLAACTEERVVNDSFSSQFGALNKQGWRVVDNSRPSGAKPADDGPEVIKPAQFNLHFSTNFQVDDPNYNHPQTQPAAQPASQPSSTPWLLAPTPSPTNRP